MGKYLATAAILIAAALVIRAGAGDTVKKTIFYGGAVGLAVLKAIGFISTAALSWPFIILLGIAGAVTDVSSTAIDDSRAIPKAVV